MLSTCHAAQIKNLTNSNDAKAISTTSRQQVFRCAVSPDWPSSIHGLPKSQGRKQSACKRARINIFTRFGDTHTLKKEEVGIKMVSHICNLSLNSPQAQLIDTYCEHVLESLHNCNIFTFLRPPKCMHWSLLAVSNPKIRHPQFISSGGSFPQFILWQLILTVSAVRRGVSISRKFRTIRSRRW